MKKVVRADKVRADLRVRPRIKRDSGEPQVVALSPGELSRLEVVLPTSGSDDWWQRAAEVREEVKAELSGRSLPPPEEIIREMREERDERVLASLR